MHNYYFKIKKGDTELEFSTDNLSDFDTKVTQWVEQICSPSVTDDEPDKPKRLGFIDIKKLVKVKDLVKEPESKEEEETTQQFNDIYEETLKKPKLDLDNVAAEENELLNLLNEKKPKTPVATLILTTFYMAHLETIPRFTIKQVNSRLVPLKQAPITHSTIDEAIESGLVEIIPDLTGLGDVTEYNLTQKGEEYFYNEL